MSRALATLLTATLLLWSAALWAQAPYSGYLPGYPYPYLPQQRQQQSDQQQSAQPRYPASGYPGRQLQQPRYPGIPSRPPGYQGWPQGATPYSPQPPSQTTASAPKLEIDLNSEHPYVQQTLILTLSIISDENLESAYPEMPRSSDLIFKRLDGPVASARKQDGKQQIVNRYRYAVTPLQPGTILIPSLRVKGRLQGRGNREFEVETKTPLLLNVKPVVPSVQPWLPLHGLILQAFLKNADEPAAGKPLTLVVDISAVGATGNLLPSLENQLADSNFRVYRESSETKGSISRDGQFLLGSRTESYTLVPLHGGRIQIPELRLEWWNVDTGQPEASTVPIRQLLARGVKSEEQQGSGIMDGSSGWMLWLPLIAVFGITAGFWVLAWLRKKRFMQLVEEEIALVLAYGYRRLSTFMIWLSPIRRLQKVRQLFVRNLPRSFRLWFCVRLVSNEDDPEVWAYMLRFLANKHLGIPPYLPLQELADRLSGIHPKADSQAMREMMGRLDNALYNGGEIDFPAWKRGFRHQLRPSLFGLGSGSQTPVRPERLPPLNPQTR